MEHNETTNSNCHPYTLNASSIAQYIDMTAPMINLANIALDVDEKTLCLALQAQGPNISTLILDITSSNVLLKTIKHLKSLEYLQICNSKAVNESVLQELALLERLSVLILDGCKKITDAALSQLQHSSSLQYLSLKNVPLISTKGMEGIAPLLAKQQLISIYLRGNTKLNDESVKTLLVSKCHSLTTIDLSKCHKLTNRSIARIADSLPNLENLMLHGCSNITDVGLCYLFPRCTSLKHLDLSNCAKVTHLALKALSTSCTSIEALYCGGCRGVTDASLKGLAEHCTNLKRLDFSEASISDDCLEYVTRLTALEWLNVRDCARLTDRSVEALKDLPMLYELNMKQCNHLTDAALELLQTHFTALQRINLRGYAKISIDSIRKLRELRPNLVVEVNWD